MAEELTPEELVRLQTAIDAGTIWATVDGGKFAMRVISAGKCKLAPGVVAMWLGGDDRYEPLYSKDELNRRTAAVLKALPEINRRTREAKAELAFLQTHRDELIRVRTTALLTAEPWLPAVVFGAVAALLSWIFRFSLWFAAAAAFLAFVVQRGRNRRRRKEAVDQINALWSRDGLPPPQSEDERGRPP